MRNKKTGQKRKSLPASFCFEQRIRIRSRRTLSAGNASVSSGKFVPVGSSAIAIPAGVAAFDTSIFFRNNNNYVKYFIKNCCLEESARLLWKNDPSETPQSVRLLKEARLIIHGKRAVILPNNHR